MSLRAICFVASTLAFALGCKSGSDESFCAAQKSAYVKRCTEGCVPQQINTSSARAACEQQCIAALPLDPQYAARCLPAGGAASAAPSK